MTIFLENPHNILRTQATGFAIGDGNMSSARCTGMWRQGLTGRTAFRSSRGDNAVAAVQDVDRAFLLPSEQESGGAVSRERRVCDRPMVAINIGESAEAVDDTVGRSVFLNGAKDIAAASNQTLRDIVGEPDQWHCWGESVSARGAESFNWHAKFDQPVKLCIELLRASAQSHVIDDVSIRSRVESAR
jgi:hypothetical protein